MRGKHGAKRQNYLLIALIILLLITFAITMWALFFRDTKPTLAPDYASQDTESNAIEFDDDDDKMEHQQGGGAVSIMCDDEAHIDIAKNKIYLSFGNPSKSTQDMLVQVKIQDVVIVQSDRIVPGYKVSELDLFDNAKLSSGKYEGKIVVYYYHPDTHEKAMINTEIPITITAR